MSTTVRRRLLIQGAVQGVGFRPFIYRLASELGIHGWVSNSAQGVIIEAEAPRGQLEQFQLQIGLQKPPHSFIQQLSVETIPTTNDTTFEIHHSSTEGSRSTIILPDLAVCPDCLREMLDPANRRYRYPFTNCTHCGPRYSIVEQLPYDRPNTAMREFVMCPDCRAEYENPLDRRFHAQPIACPRCGPQLNLWDQAGRSLAVRDDALLMAGDVIRAGAIVALKGIGGFQLLVDARNDEALHRLRERKQRPHKPFAVMMPSLEQVKAACEVSDAEQRLLCSAAAPIVLLRRHDENHTLCHEVAPANPNLGVMLPYSPLHHLLMAELGFPVVATSGNRSGEPLCIDEHEALTRLQGIADYYLIHDRPIVRPIDDSVTRVISDTECVLRRARGYAPLPLEVSNETAPIIATGAHLKNTVAVSVGKQIFVSQHIGDLGSPEALSAFQNELTDLQALYEQPPARIACDLHPDYRSTHLAEQLAAQGDIPLIRVQHHYAHVLACMAEHRLTAPVLGIAWDGTGYGTDGTIWGGEFLGITSDAGNHFDHYATLRPFPLLGGEQAIHDPRRIALGLLLEMQGATLLDNTFLGFSPSELSLLKAAWAKHINTPLTSSMGRLFDGVAALLGPRQRVSFEGQAAMDLEFACDGLRTDRWYAFDVTPDTTETGTIRRIIEWKSVIEALLADLTAGVSVGEIAATFHNTLVEMIITIATQCQIEQVVLSGGCFQNKRLLEASIFRLKQLGFRPYWNQQFPLNDGGIALGQIVAAMREERKQRCV